MVSRRWDNAASNRFDDGQLTSIFTTDAKELNNLRCALPLGNIK